jgi:hypothetical protein
MASKQNSAMLLLELSDRLLALGVHHPVGKGALKVGGLRGHPFDNASQNASVLICRYRRSRVFDRHSSGAI